MLFLIPQSVQSPVYIYLHRGKFPVYIIYLRSIISGKHMLKSWNDDLEIFTPGICTIIVEKLYK